MVMLIYQVGYKFCMLIQRREQPMLQVFIKRLKLGLIPVNNKSKFKDKVLKSLVKSSVKIINLVSSSLAKMNLRH